jgi:cytochrome c oxidase assembly protein subunit 15
MQEIARRRLERFAWAVLGYTVLVILFGAWVRITGSGAGCGEHWPSCHGALVPRSPTLATIIEFTHRVTSGLCLLSVLALVWLARRVAPRGHPVRLGAALAVLFTITEALVGAGLVRFGLVDKDDSVARAVVMAIHLVNTSLLTAALAYTAWRARAPVAVQAPPRRAGLWLGAALVGLLIVGVSGAVTALGDTLFPAQQQGLVGRIAEDHGAGAHFLQRLRVFHPFLAVGIGLYVLVIANTLSSGPHASADARRWGGLVILGVLVQVTAGVANILLSAPGWMQVVHLLLGTGLWIAVIVFALTVLGPRRS